jgi:DNA-binding MarR family transcriptional regulator
MGGLDDTAGDVSPAVVASRLQHALVHLKRQLRHHDPPGLGMTMHSALWTIAGRGELGIGDLADAERLPSSAASRIADTLEEAGLVVRQRNPDDRRGVRLAITDHGRQLVEEHRRLGNAWLAGRLSLLAPDQLTTLAEAVELLVTQVLAEGDTGGPAPALGWTAGDAAAGVPAGAETAP